MSQAEIIQQLAETLGIPVYVLIRVLKNLVKRR